MKLACSIRARFPRSIQLQIVQRRVGEDIPGVLTGAFLSVVATTITLKTHGSVPMSTIAIFHQQSASTLYLDVLSDIYSKEDDTGTAR
jgi:hypothetical protein